MICYCARKILVVQLTGIHKRADLKGHLPQCPTAGHATDKKGHRQRRVNWLDARIKARFPLFELTARVNGPS